MTFRLALCLLLGRPLVSVLCKTQAGCYQFNLFFLVLFPPPDALVLITSIIYPPHPLSSRLSSLARLPRSRPLSGAAPCARLRGLTPGQVGVCRARGEVMESVRKAAEMVIEEVHLKGHFKCFFVYVH